MSTQTKQSRTKKSPAKNGRKGKAKPDPVVSTAAADACPTEPAKLVEAAKEPESYLVVEMDKADEEDARKSFKILSEMTAAEIQQIYFEEISVTDGNFFAELPHVVVQSVCRLANFHCPTWILLDGLRAMFRNVAKHEPQLLA